MHEAFLFATVCVLLVFILWLEWMHMKERRTLVNTIISRNPHEVRMLNRDVDRPEPRDRPALDPEETEFWQFGEPVGL